MGGEGCAQYNKIGFEGAEVADAELFSHPGSSAVIARSVDGVGLRRTAAAGLHSVV